MNVSENSKMKENLRAQENELCEMNALCTNDLERKYERIYAQKLRLAEEEEAYIKMRNFDDFMDDVDKRFNDK